MTCQTAIPLNPPYECDSPYLGINPGPIMMVGFCSKGAFGSDGKGQPSSAGFFQAPSFNVVDYADGSVHFIPVWIHWTGTAWTGLTTYYVRPSDGKIIFSTPYVPGFAYGNVVNGHLFADMPEVKGLGVGINMAWNGTYYECGVSITEYTVNGSRAKNKSGLVYPTSYTYHLDYFLDLCNTTAQPTLDYGPAIINPVKAPPLATIQFGPDNLIGDQTYPNAYQYRPPAYLTSNGYYNQLTGFPTYVQAVGELDETITNLIYAWNGEWNQPYEPLSPACAFKLECYDLGDLPDEIGYLSFPYPAGTGAPCNCQPSPISPGGIFCPCTYYYSTSFEYVVTCGVVGQLLPVYFIPPWTPEDLQNPPGYCGAGGIYWQGIVDAYCAEFGTISKTSLGSATNFAATQGLGPFSVYNQVSMWPDGYALYVFALGSSNWQQVPGAF